MIMTLLGQVKQYRRDSILTPVFTAMEVLMEVLIPFITASLIDQGIEAGNMTKVLQYGGLMLAIAFCSLACGALAGTFAASAASGFACNLRDGMYENIQRFSFSNIDKFSTAGLVTRMTTDVTNARLSLVFVAAIIVLGCVLALIVKCTTKIFDVVFRKYDALNASVQENVSAIRVVKAFVREDHENRKFTDAAGQLYQMFVKAESILAFNNPTMMLVIYGCVLSLSWFGAHLVVGGDMTTGQLTSMFSYIMSILMSLMMLSMIFVMVTMSAASGRRIAEILEEQPDLVNPDRPITEIPDGSIDFDHVSFSYKHGGSGKETLADIDLHIRSGETVGVIGQTGCGKSSLVNLISRLYDVTQGSVRVGGIDVRRYDMEALRDQVAVVLQKNVLFTGTILDNLRWGNEQATRQECEEVCRLACADEFISRLPDGYGTHIEQGGSNVSGGQKQRLCIARALLKKPRVLILDDSTSAVDTATDARIRAAFAEHIPGTTKIIIAQRVSSVEHADRILVLNEGRISGFDTHENLLSGNIIYREIYETQMKGGGDFDQPGGIGKEGEENG